MRSRLRDGENRIAFRAHLFFDLTKLSAHSRAGRSNETPSYATLPACARGQSSSPQCADHAR
jgi:hypothetical protein